VKKAVLLANKVDLPDAAAKLDGLRARWASRFEIVPVSASRRDGLEDLRRATLSILDLVRVYSKEPGKKPDLAAPYVLPRGSTVLDLAARIHRDLATHFDFARLWKNEHEGGIRIGRDHVLVDREILEIHAKA
jgi:ribosome-interacting GTPase 1